MKKGAILLILIFGVIIAYKSFFFVVDVTEYAIITQLGKPKKTITEPGLYLRLPFIQNIIFFSKKLMEYDAPPSEILTKDKKALVVDNYCRWKIIEPLKFYLSFRDVRSALARIDDIIYSEMRIELGKHNLIDVVSKNRNEIMKNVTIASKLKAKDFGIEIIDIRIKRADLPPENEKAVYARMKAERERIAKQYRSEGYEEAQKIRAKTEKERTIILAEAYRKVQEIKGNTDAKVIKIYADAFSKDPNFYDFLKKLEVHENSFDNKTKLFLSTNSEIYKMLKSIK
ncbi:membrane protease subunit HflC [Deferribacter desulfuricans SSM1]|uniref:Protein HflC n=1 Tax=Deferribacter desulfuricans (strain DSM 14783 / JCM 11476 / NBRC 101012 / SSM1) TaxID=639282 RepID=D3PEH3_DEFDS|nr:protease modulator HflC [Deferribacter desulfuricans]BAI80996.1 membrane protease subunit HflC [Deferribacter desulfuricans SSM1]